MARRRLWLDDVRPPPPGLVPSKAGWTWVKTARWAISELYTQSYDMVSLDYDLDRNPIKDSGKPGNGYEVLRFLENKAYDDPSFFVPRIFIHTTNPLAFIRMHLALRAMKRETGKG